MEVFFDGPAAGMDLPSDLFGGIDACEYNTLGALVDGRVASIKFGKD